MDGIPINTADGLFDLFEIDPTAYRYVEVYKGANALRYGANSLVSSGRTMVSGALVCGLVATAALIGQQGADALELPLTGLASGKTWRVGFETSFGMTAVVAAVAMSAGLLAKRRHARRLSFSA